MGAKPADEAQVVLLEDADFSISAMTVQPTANWRSELRVIMGLAIPVMTTMATQQGMVVTDQIMVGHLGAEELAAAALGNTVRSHASARLYTPTV
jgi:Na+-driven multidrug efflux pump